MRAQISESYKTNFLSSVKGFVSLTPLKIPGCAHPTGSTQDRAAAHWVPHLSNFPSKFWGRSKDPATLRSWYFICSISWNAINAAGKGCEEFSCFGLHWLAEISVWNCGREKLYDCSNFIWGFWGPHCHALYLTALCCYWTPFADLLCSLEIMRPARFLLYSRMCEAAVCWTSTWVLRAQGAHLADAENKHTASWALWGTGIPCSQFPLHMACAGPWGLSGLF